MANLTIKQLESAIPEYLGDDNISVDEYVTTIDNVTGLVNQIGKIVNIQQQFVDIYPELDGDTLPLGKDIEEWFEDLTMPSDFDADGSDTLAPDTGSYRKTYFSLNLGKKTFKKTVRTDKFNQYALTMNDVTRLITSTLATLSNAETVYKNYLKRGLLFDFVDKVTTALYDAEDLDEMPITTKKGENFKDTDGVVYTTINAGKLTTQNVPSMLEAGNIVINNTVEVLAVPEDETTVKAFLLSVDKIMEKTMKESEGNSLSGNTLGVQNKNDLILYVNDGILPLVNQYKSTLLNDSLLDFKTKVKPIGDLINMSHKQIYNKSKPYAVLVDTRGIKLHVNHVGTDSQKNGKGEFVNYYRHIGFTGHYSRNTFIHVWQDVPETTAGK